MVYYAASGFSAPCDLHCDSTRAPARCGILVDGPALDERLAAVVAGLNVG